MFANIKVNRSTHDLDHPEYNLSSKDEDFTRAELGRYIVKAINLADVYMKDTTIVIKYNPETQVADIDFTGKKVASSPEKVYGLDVMLAKLSAERN